DDLIAIRQLQTRGVQLDLERAVLWPHTPLQAALAGHLPYTSIGAETLVLYPSATRRARAIGFLQARARRGRPEADVVYLAPALDADDDAVAIWYRLLAECAHEIGGRGGQRVFAQIPPGDGVEEVFRQAGFNAYAREEIFYLRDFLPALEKSNGLRRQRARDGWDLLRLYTELTPRPVQLAEGMLSPEGQGGKVGDWWDQSRGAGYILEKEGELAGAARIRRGRAAYWLRLGLHPQAREYADELLRGALALLWAAPHQPIYCSVREYESGIARALESAGFERWQTRSLLVKHTTARAKEPFLKLIPALEPQPKPAAYQAER
ncbi:MAG: hypothetical protein L0Y55_20870, partial [Anaerolineales bacterium]|nr:hypothetical protein [Anaerolineales bacterium]